MARLCNLIVQTTSPGRFEVALMIHCFMQRWDRWLSGENVRSSEIVGNGAVEAAPLTKLGRAYADAAAIAQFVYFVE